MAENTEQEELISSEWVHDYLQEIPSGLIRWGTLAVFFVVFCLCLVTWFIHYPVVVRADFRLTSLNAPQPVIAKTDGRIEKLFVSENQFVSSGKILAYIESNAKHEEVLQLEKELNPIREILEHQEFSKLENLKPTNFNHLGEVQTIYSTFQQNYVQVITLLYKGFYLKKRQFLVDEIMELEQMKGYQYEQLKIYEQDVQLAEKAYQANQKLYNEKVVAALDLNQEESKMLAKKLPIKSTESAILNNNALKNAKQKEILDLDRNFKEQTEALNQALSNLQSSIEAWKNRYLLSSPSNGIVHFSSILQEKQQVKSGTEIIFLTQRESKTIGEVRIPQTNFGKIVKNQRVIIKFQGYPFEEYGAVEGVVAKISAIPTADNQFFIATVNLPTGLTTNYGKKLTYRSNMMASAEIITEDLRLIERLFYQFRRLVN